MSEEKEVEELAESMRLAALAKLDKARDACVQEGLVVALSLVDAYLTMCEETEHTPGFRNCMDYFAYSLNQEGVRGLEFQAIMRGFVHGYVVGRRITEP